MQFIIINKNLTHSSIFLKNLNRITACDKLPIRNSEQWRKAKIYCLYESVSVFLTDEEFIFLPSRVLGMKEFPTIYHQRRFFWFFRAYLLVLSNRIAQKRTVKTVNI